MKSPHESTMADDPNERKIRESKKKAFSKLTMRASGLSAIFKNPEIYGKDFGLFASLRMYRNIKENPALKARIHDACETNDFAFLVALGKELQRKETRLEDINHIELALVIAWIDGPMAELGFPDLCYFSNEALHDLFSVSFPQIKKTDIGSIGRLRRRLGLTQGEIRVKKVKESSPGVMCIEWVDWVDNPKK